jgi:hypothetical protein
MSVAKHERERGLKMAEVFDLKRPPWLPFFSGVTEMQGSFSARERSWLALARLSD